MNTPPPVQDNSILRETHLRDYWKIVWQGRWTVLAVFVVVVGLTALWTFLQAPIYQSTVTLEVQPKARQITSGADVSGIGAGGYGWFAEEKYHNTQVEILGSRDVATRVFAKLGLENHPYLSEVSDPIDSFRKRVRAVPRRETGLIEVSMVGTDPEEITQWVNAVAHEYVDRNFDKAKGNMSQAFSAIQSQVNELRASFQDAQKDRFEQLDNLQFVTSEYNEEIVQESLKSLNRELTENQLELDKLREKLRQVRELNLRGGGLMSIEDLGNDPQLKELVRREVELNGELQRARVELKAGHPRYEEIEGELATVRQEKSDRVSQILGSLQNRYDSANRRDRVLREQIREAESQSRTVTRETAQYDLVKTEAAAAEQVFEMIALTMNEVSLNAQLLTNNVSVLDEATIPQYPISPRKKLNLAMGCVFGLFLGIAAAFFQDYLDNTFRTPEDIEKYLKSAVLAVVPRADPSEQEGRAVQEAYQSLRTSIIFSSESRKRRIVLVTSTNPQEGKSSTVARLGRTLAAAGDRVIILDCDLRRPTQHMHHKAKRDSGITNYLAQPEDRADWTQFVQQVGSGNLDMLACGPIPPSPPELLGGERFSEMIEELKGRYDWVLIDSPPAASLADTVLLATLADMVVLVVQHNRTDRDLVVKTMQRLRSVNPHVAGAVLNNVDLDRAYNKDYYYAGYYYSEDAPAKGKKKREKKVNVG